MKQIFRLKKMVELKKKKILHRQSPWGRNPRRHPKFPSVERVIWCIYRLYTGWNLS